MNEFKEYEQEFLEAPGTSRSERLKFMELKRLDRIADVLEDINGALINMGGDIEALGECAGYVPPRQGYVKTEGYRFLRIGGIVDTGV